MADLSFLNQLNEEQLEYARKVGEKAKEMGIPPALAISIAYHESRLNPNVGRGSSGEFGIMQVMPSTGKGMGYTNKDLADTDKNIEAGLKYLKQNYDAFGGDARLATIGYNAGTDSPFFSGGKLPKVTEDYLKAMKVYGAFATPSAQPQAAETQPDAPEETDAQRNVRMQAAMDAQEKRQAQIIGAGAGAGISATRAAGSGAGAVLQAGATRVGQGFRAGMQPPPAPLVMPGAAVPPGALVTPGAPVPPPSPVPSVVRRPIPLGGPDGGRLAPGQTGTMPYNYAKSAGLTDIEAGRALDMTKQTGGVHDLTTQRREGLQRIQQLFPTETYTENPRYGGIMTPEQGAGGGPRQSFAARPAVAPTPNMPQGQPGVLSQLPPRQPIPTAPIAPKPPSGLDAVTSMFKGMMRPLATAAQVIGKYALPPLALASAAGEGANIAQQMQKPEDQRDITGMALSGANILGSGLSMYPPTMPVGIPLSIGSGLAQAYRENPDFLKQKMAGSANIPLLEEMTGPLP